MGSWRPWSSLSEFEKVRRDLDDTLARLMGREEAEPVEEGVIEPAVECFVEEGKFVVRLDLPGVEPADIEVNASEGLLTVRATRGEERVERKREFIEHELPYGTFERAIELPEGVQAEDIRATYRNGVLELTAPIKAEEEKKVKIQVEARGAEGKSAAEGKSRGGA